MQTLATTDTQANSKPLNFEELLLGDTVHLLRVSWGLSLNELAKRAGLGRKTVLLVERGQPASCRTLERLAEALDVPSEGLSILTPGRSLPTIMAANDNGEPIAFSEAGEPGSWTWHCLPFEQDPWARDLCNELQDDGREMTLEAIGKQFGRSTSWAEVEVKRALRKLGDLPDFEDVEDWL